MKRTAESPGLTFARSIAIGVLLSMVFFYCIHLFGEWMFENYRVDLETTNTPLLHNRCAIFNDLHTLRPGGDVQTIGDGIDGTKMAASFMNFFDGHVSAMIVTAIIVGAGIFGLRMMRRRRRAAGSVV